MKTVKRTGLKELNNENIINRFKKFIYYFIDIIVILDLFLSVIVFQIRFFDTKELVTNLIFVLTLYFIYILIEKPMYKQLYKKVVN